MIRRDKDIYSKYFPPTLFLNPDMKNSMHFVLSLRYLPDYLLEETINLLQVCGAKVSLDLEDVTEHSILIVDHDMVMSTKAPAFDVEFLKDCLKLCKIQDITKYRQISTCHIVEDIQCMDVIYYRKTSWSSVMNSKEKQWLEKHVVVNQVEDSDETVCDNDDFERRLEPEVETPDPAVVKETPGCSHWVGHRKKKEGNSIKCEPPGYKEHKKLVSDGDSDIEELPSEQRCEAPSYPVHSKLVSDGDSDIEELPKEHRCEPPSNEEPGKIVSDGNADIEKILKEELGSQPIWISKEIVKRKPDLVPVKKKKKKVSGENQEKGVKKKFSFWSSDEESSDGEVKEKNVLEEKRRRKHTRQPYSDTEKINILKYIISHNEFARIKGREMWTIMERRKVCPLRTWQSMKEHFLKKIVVNLDKFEFLTKNDKMKFMRAFTNS